MASTIWSHLFSCYFYRMRRFICLLSLLALTLTTVEAKVVTEEQAAKTAEKLLSSAKSNTVKSFSAIGSQKLKLAVMKSDTGNSAPEYFIFNNEGGGFAIIAGDDCISPVIGYSSDGKFANDGMPENLKAWLDMWKGIVNGYRSGKYATSDDTVSEWEQLQKSGLKVSAASKILSTASWNQDEPYNNMCPDFGEGHCLTGCGATATAIVMKYFEYPESGSGTLGSYEYIDGSNKRQISGYALGDKYEWSKITLTYDSQSTDEEKNAVAKLMKDVSVMLQSEYYSPSKGTSTSIFAPLPAMVAYMGYDASAVWLLKSNYSNDEWLSMIKNNIDSYGPLIYTGQSSSGGHAFVVDGYSENSLHINWGWGGTGNGLYTFPTLRDFTDDNNAVFGLKKGAGGKPAPNLSFEAIGLTSSSKEFKTGVPFDATASYIYNLSFADFAGKIGVGHTDKYGNLKNILASNNIDSFASLSGLRFEYNNLTIANDIKPGDMLMMFYCASGETEWKTIPYNREDGTKPYIILREETLEDSSAIYYDENSKLLLIVTPDNAQCSVRKGGQEVSTGVIRQPGVTAVNFGVLPFGEYSVTLTRGSDTKSLTIKMGYKQ